MCKKLPPSTATLFTLDFRPWKWHSHVNLNSWNINQAPRTTVAVVRSWHFGSSCDPALVSRRCRKDGRCVLWGIFWAQASAGSWECRSICTKDRTFNLHNLYIVFICTSTYTYIYIHTNILYTERDGDGGGHSVRDRDSDSVLNRYHKFYLSKPEYIYSMKTGWNASNSCCQSWLQCCSIQFQDFCLTHPFWRSLEDFLKSFLCENFLSPFVSCCVQECRPQVFLGFLFKI